MTKKIDPKVAPQELIPALVGPISVSLSGSLLQDVNTYRQIGRFLSVFPKGTPSYRQEPLLEEQLKAIKGIALFVSSLAESEAAKVCD
ncbi:hypothetical protein [Pseudomonas palleroniana]